jgi:hypothetical protein
LPEAGKAVVLEHLLSQMTPETLKALAPEIRTKLLADLGAAPASPLRKHFDAICVPITINGQSFDVAVPDETYGKARYRQWALAGQVGGEMGTRDLNLAVANYLLDREASYLLAQEETGNLTNKEAEVLAKHRSRWEKDAPAEKRAGEAAPITNNEAELLATYRSSWVRDTEGGVEICGVCPCTVDADGDSSIICALIVRASPESII